MRIYNTLTGKKEDFEPYQKNHVKMYVCGPTVYNLLHVGNMRCYVIFDSIRRYLEYKGFTVTMVQNFTDVDDKIIQRSYEEKISAKEVADKYIEEALKDYKTLNICPAEHYPRVTEEMDEIIQMISQLVEAGHAYVRSAGGSGAAGASETSSVFFDAVKFKDYGKLSKKNVDDLLAGARVVVDDQKQNPVDFVLWKPHKEGEPYWESPWGPGRPGWHIECSAIVRKYLGMVDIHGGGEDLIFPHHENEKAQSEALLGEPFAKYWLHNGPLTSGHKKMSKSLGNFFTFREVSEKFRPEVIRFFLLSGHYRMPMEYSEALLESSGKGLERIKNCRVLLKEIIMEVSETKVSETEVAVTEVPETKVPETEISKIEETWLKEAQGFEAAFNARMDDDFNTADAISTIFDLVKFSNVKLRDSRIISKPFAKGLLNLLDKMCGLLGLDLDSGSELQAEIEAKITQRQEARKNKDWAAADKIRDELASKGITLEDTPTGVRWTMS